MRDLNILKYVAGTLWSITEDKWAEIVPVLMRHARGERLSAEDIQARLGASEPGPRTQGGGVAVVPIRGVIAHRADAMDESSGGTSTERISAMLRQVMADSSIGTVILDVDSPGGTVPGVQELAGEIFEMKGRGTKRIVAVANSLMASAAYWLASQADEIVSIPSGTIGSIGVFSAHSDISKALEKEGVKVTLISAGKYKVEGNPFEPLSEEGLAVRQASVDAAYALFVKDVARGRGVSVSDVRNGFGEGRALPAKDAKAAGLIDRIASMEDVLSKAVGRKASGMRAMVPVAGDDVKASFHAEDETLAETEARMVTPECGLVDDDDMERRLRTL